MRHQFYTLDVFTEARFAGNPLAVVLDADGLDTAKMQAVAREFNLSETVFVLKPVNPAHTARIRIFTPVAELPFAGHPTVGTAVLLAQLRGPEGATNQDSIISLEETIGPVRVGVRFRPGEAPLGEFDAPKLPEEIGAAPPVERLATALSLLSSEIGFANHKPTRYSAGVPYTFVPVASLEAIAKASVELHSWAPAFGSSGHNAAFLYCRETLQNASAFHARMFVPGNGVMEDPATGSAAAAFAAVVHRFDTPPDGTHKRVIEQGFEMGRPSLITLSIEVERGKLHGVRIAGHAVRVSEGQIEI